MKDLKELVSRFQVGKVGLKLEWEEEGVGLFGVAGVEGAGAAGGASRSRRTPRMRLSRA